MTQYAINLGTGSVEERADTGFKAGRIGEVFLTASRLVNDCAHVRAGETVLIVTDPEVSPLVAETLTGAALAAGALPFTLRMPQQVVHGEEPPELVEHALLGADVIFGAVSKSITHTLALRKALDSRSRYIGLSSVSEDSLIRGAATADPARIRAIGNALRDRLKVSSSVRVTSEFGMDVTFAIGDRPLRVSDGVIPENGTWQGDRRRMFPDGECHTCPIEESVEGVIVVDRWMQGIGVLDDPIRWHFERGRCIKIDGGPQAEALADLVRREGDENSYYVGEFAIGINPNARLSGNAHREGKKVLGSIHFALGTGAQLGGKLRSRLHLDGIALRPSLHVDGEALIERGKLAVPVDD